MIAAVAQHNAAWGEDRDRPGGSARVDTWDEARGTCTWCGVLFFWFLVLVLESGVVPYAARSCEGHGRGLPLWQKVSFFLVSPLFLFWLTSVVVFCVLHLS